MVPIYREHYFVYIVCLIRKLANEGIVP